MDLFDGFGHDCGDGWDGLVHPCPNSGKTDLGPDSSSAAMALPAANEPWPAPNGPEGRRV